MMDIFERNGARFFAADDMIVQWCRKQRREFEPKTTEFIFGVLAERGGRFIDVGASTGWFTVPVALRGFPVTALEPNVRVFGRLQDNIALNEGAAERVHALPVAASNTNGSAVFYHNPLVPLTSGGSIEAPTCRGPMRETVPTIALDSLAASEAFISLIKVDVEGHELLVLDGARRLIEEARPALVLEANDETARVRLKAWCNSHGYDCEAADDRNLLCRPLPW